MIRQILTIVAASFYSVFSFGASPTKPLVTAPVKANSVSQSATVTASSATMVCTKGQGDKLLCKPLETGEIEFTTNNLIVMRGPITSQSASQFVKTFHELEHKDEVARIYIYLRSPGGSIFAGDYISNIIQSSKKEVVVVIDFAASMAFHVAQYADKRLMLPTGTMMQHHASGGTGDGQFPNVDKQWDWIKRKVGMMNKKDAAACSKISYNDFMKNIDRDWWLLSDEALAAGCIDGIASRVTCSKDLSNKTIVESVSLLGVEVELSWSACPLETYPRDVKLRVQAGQITAEQNKLVDEYITLVTDPLQYYNTKGSFDLDKFVDKKFPQPQPQANPRF
jgi:ATP-dependent Clp endopeptidase proteolytic subunit ClpP